MKSAPNAADMSEGQFALAAHQHYYPDVPLADYLSQLGIDRRSVIDETMGTDYYKYAMSALEKPGKNETPEQAAARFGGKLSKREPNFLENVMRAFGQGGMMGWGDEVVAGGAAALDPLVHGESGKGFGERYDTYLNRERGNIDSFRKENPVAAYGAEIAGAIPTAIVAGGGVGGQGTTMLQRVGTNLAVNAGQGAVYGAGASDGDLGDRVKGAGLGAVTGAATGAALDGVAGIVNAAFKGGAKNRALNQAIDGAPAAGDLKAKSQAAYTAADTSGVTIKPTATSILKSDLGSFLATEGLMQNGKVAGNFGLVKRALKHLESFDGRPMTMKELQRLEESFQDVAASKKAGEGRIGKMMLDQFDDYVDALPQQAFAGGNGVDAAASWKAGKQGWAEFKRTKAIEDAVYSARLSGNFSEGFRSELRSLLKNDRKRSRFSDSELKAMEDFVMGGPVGKVMKAFSQGGGLPGSIMGGLAGGPLGAAAAVVGPAAAKLGLDKGARRAGDVIRAQVASGGTLNVPQPGNVLNLQPAAAGVGNADPDIRKYLEILVTGGGR